MKKLGIKPEDLPWIRASDPVVKAIGGKPGDIIKITRNSKLTGTSIALRYVISG